MKIISLGWGVQSWTLAAMAALGDVEPVDYVVHADTTHEASWTYAFAASWTPWLEQHGVRVVTVKSKEKLLQPLDSGKFVVDIPAFTFGENTNGQIKRQCTSDWKIANIRRWLQANRNGERVEQWIGISLDEALRMKPSDVKYITHRWPLIEKRMTRNDCVNWLERHGLEVPQKSSCYFCPFHSTAEWRRIKDDGNGDWQKALEADEQIRKARPPYDLYLHPSRKPLGEVDLRNAEERGQMSLWDEECTGVCGI